MKTKTIRKVKEFAGSYLVHSTIYDVDLPAELLKEILYTMFETEKLLDVEQEYRLDILFDCRVYECDEFYSFPLSKHRPLPRGRRKLSEDELKEEMIGYILSEQLDNVKDALKKSGINVRYSYIVGEDDFSPHFVEFVFHSLENEPGVKYIEARASVIMPSRSGFYKNLEKSAKDYEERKLHEQQRKEIEEKLRAQHVPNWFSAEELFSKIAQSLYPSDGDKAIQHKEMLYKTAIQISGWPLQLKSKGKTEGDALIDKDTKLDCPEYILYIQQTTGEWRIEKTEDLKSAQQRILKNGYNLKTTSRIVVLHNLQAVPYTLFKETDEGLVVVTPEEAQGQKKLHLSWNKLGG